MGRMAGAGLLRNGGERIVYEGIAFQSRRCFRGIKKKALRKASKPQHGVEEIFKLKRTFLLYILAVASAALLPLAATSQVYSPKHPRATDQGERTFKYEVYG